MSDKGTQAGVYLPSRQAGDTLFNLDMLREVRLEHAALMGVEGYIDYSRAMTIEARATAPDDGITAAKLLSLAKARAIDPTVFDEADGAPFFFGGEATSSRWDAYNTRMGESSLQNYAADFAEGVAYLRGHNTRVEPIGGTLTGTFSVGKGKLQGSSASTTRADVYMVRDPDSMPMIMKIRSGIQRDQSIGFFGGQYMCTICGRDMADWYSDEGCPHWLGMMYTPLDSKGKPKEGAEKVMAMAVIENAHVAELSGVYDGATPGAMIDKARALSDQGQLDQRTHQFLQARYKIALPVPARTFPSAALGTRKVEHRMEQDDIDALQAQLTVAQDKNRELTASLKVYTDLSIPGLPEELAAAPRSRAVEWLVGERARLVPLADDGVKYRKDSVEAALVEGTRALGADFNTETYRSILEASPITAIQRMREDWAKVADTVFPKGGRQFAEKEPEIKKPEESLHSRQLSNAAFRG